MCIRDRAWLDAADDSLTVSNWRGDNSAASASAWRHRIQVDQGAAESLPVTTVRLVSDYEEQTCRASTQLYWFSRSTIITCIPASKQSCRGRERDVTNCESDERERVRPLSQEVVQTCRQIFWLQVELLCLLRMHGAKEQPNPPKRLHIAVTFTSFIGNKNK